MATADCFGLCGDAGARYTFSNAQVAFTRDAPLLALAAPGDTIELELCGGGQELHIRDLTFRASARIASLKELLTALDDELRKRAAPKKPPSPQEPAPKKPPSAREPAPKLASPSVPVSPPRESPRGSAGPTSPSSEV